jgi:hypothetical protein
MDSPIQGNPLYALPKINQSISIICVIGDTNVLTRPVREYAHDIGASFTTRIYDADSITDDRNYIERLPAFHVYVKKRNLEYRKTFYLDSNYVDEIDEVIKYVEKREEIKKQRSQAWRRRLAPLIKLIPFYGSKSSPAK